MGKPTVISLFTGAGGLDLGFEAAGFRTAAAVEMDRDCLETLKRNSNRKRAWAVVPSPVEEVSSGELLRAAGLRRGTVDVLVGGPPCQPFSKSGYWHRGDSLRLDDPRASTLRQFMRVLRDTQPRVFVLENVAGLKYGGKDEGFRYVERAIRRINATSGTRYELHTALLNAAWFGVPQLRERVFIVGHAEGRPFTFPRARFGELGAEPFRTAWDALGDLPPQDDIEETRPTGFYAELLRCIPEGANYLFHTDRGCAYVADDGERLRGKGSAKHPLFGWRRRYWSFLLKLSKWLPSWTITAQPGPAIGPFHWENRRLTRAELCRLQTFPDGYQLSGTLSAAQRQAGNAVPSLLAEVLALEIRRQLLDHPVSSARPTLLKEPCALPPPPPRFARRIPQKYLDQERDVRPHGEHKRPLANGSRAQVAL